MKNQALFSSKGKSKKIKCHLLQFLFGALRVNTFIDQTMLPQLFSLHIRRLVSPIIKSG